MFPSIYSQHTKTREELQKVIQELQKVLKKHNCDLFGEGGNLSILHMDEQEENIIKSKLIFDDCRLSQLNKFNIKSMIQWKIPNLKPFESKSQKEIR